MLSTFATLRVNFAKHLDACQERPVWITHIVTQRVSGHRTPLPSVFRSLVAAPYINARVRCAGLAQGTMWVIHTDPSLRFMVTMKVTQ